jgi:hypothetical protein
MIKYGLALIVLMIILAGCNNESIVIPKISATTFEKMMNEAKDIDAKYDVVDGKTLPQQYEPLIADYESLKGKLDSMDGSNDVNAAIRVVDFKLNLFRAMNSMRSASFQITDDICDKKTEFESAYKSSTDAVDSGRAAISAIDDFIKNYPDYLKKVDSESILKMRSDLESEISRLDTSTKSLKEYFDSVCR